MLKNINYSKILFLYRNCPIKYDFNDLDEREELWIKRQDLFRKESLNAEEVYEKAGIYAEFGKVVCISLGFVLQKMERHKFG